MRLRLAGALAARGHRVQLIVQCGRGPLIHQIPPGIALHDLAKPRSWRAMWALARTLRACRPDFLVSSLDHNNIVALCAGILAGGRSKIIICQHNTLSAEVVDGWRYRVVPLLYRLLGWRADAIIAVSEGVAADLVATAGFPERRISVIYNPVVKECPPPSACVPHPWLGPSVVPVFIFVGRLVAQKDPMLMLEAFALRLRHGPARLIFCGDGPMLRQLQDKTRELAIQDDVYFAGFLMDPLPWMKAASALVLTSRYEGFANVIVEAMWCGTPVIATDCACGPREILANGRFGRLVSVGDAPALARCMQESLRAAYPDSMLIARAQAFSVHVCVARHEKLFSKLLPPRRRKVFGLDIVHLDARGVSQHVLEQQADAVRLVVTPNIDHLRLLRDPRFRAAYQFASIICADGFPVALYAWLRGVGSGRRVTGCDIFHQIALQVNTACKRVVVVAESTETANAVEYWATRQYSGAAWIAVVAPKHLCDDPIGQHWLTTEINSHAPDIVVLTLGAPASEIFVYQNREALAPCWALCVGQAVRIEVGLTPRAPAIFQYCHLEWAWRVALEPRRLIGRYIRSALAFPAAIVEDLRRPH